MAMPALLIVVGLVVPLVLHVRGGSGDAPRLVVAGHVSALAVAWVGVYALLANVAGMRGAGAGGVVELCQLVVSWSRDQSPAAATVAAAILVLLPGRALWHLGRSCAAQVRLRRALRLSGPRQSVAQANIPTVACTVGLLTPRVVVDADRFPRLPARHQHTILAHERQHVRGRHLIVDAVTRCLAAGLLPWPGARIAMAEVRRHLEAMADDAAAKVVGPQAVATAIVDVACGPAPRIGALGVEGWATWRVDRLLRAPGRSLWATSVSLVVVALAAVVALHLVAHPLHSLVDLPSTVWSAVCCVV
jgi:Zn-dependent protease with chaperone function